MQLYSDADMQNHNVHEIQMITTELRDSQWNTEHPVGCGEYLYRDRDAGILSALLRLSE